MNNVLVTAIYNHSPFSRIGGRGYNMDFYKAPFYNIVKLGLPLVVFTHDDQYTKIQQFFESINFTEYKLIIFDLETADITDKILQLKESIGIIDKNGLAENVSVIRNDRNHTLCLKKPYFLKTAIENKFFNGENYYWIDAGLFHHGLFPESIGGKERLIKIDETTYWPTNQQSIFRSGLVESLMKKSPQDYIFIKSNALYGTPTWWSELYSDTIHYGHVVGGFFGGNVQTTLELYEQFNEVMNILFNQDVLSLEEEILSFIYAKHYSHYKLYEFDTWNHDVETDPCYVGTSKEMRCFYKIFV